MLNLFVFRQGATRIDFPQNKEYEITYGSPLPHVNQQNISKAKNVSRETLINMDQKWRSKMFHVKHF